MVPGRSPIISFLRNGTLKNDEGWYKGAGNLKLYEVSGLLKKGNVGGKKKVLNWHLKVF